jgi:hypothetical protein
MFPNLSQRNTFVLVVLILTLTAPVVLAGQPTIHGIVSQGYLNSTDYNYLMPSEGGSFAFNEMMLNVSSSVSDNVRVGLQVMARNLGSDGNEDVVLDWAYGDYRWRDELGVRIGKVKTPLGFYNQTRDVDMVRNSILLPQSVYSEVFRDVLNAFEGVSLYGSLAIGETSSVEYDAFVGTIDVDRTQFPVPQLIQPMLAPYHGGYLPTAGWTAETKQTYGGAVRFNTPLEGFRVGGSIFVADLEGSGTFSSPYGHFNPEFKMDVKQMYILSAEYTTERWVLSAELNRSFVDFELNGTLMPTGMPEPAPAAVLMDLATKDARGGYYGQGTFQVNDWLQLGSYYSMYYPEYHMRDGEGHDYFQQDIALTARFDIMDNWLIKLEGHAMSGVGGLYESLNVGNPYNEENWSMFGAKSTFYF